MKKVRNHGTDPIAVNWNHCYEVGETPWDKGRGHPVLGGAEVVGLLQGRVLVPGCGLGHDVRALAGGGLLDVTGLDVACVAVDRARKMEGTGRERYVCGDLFESGMWLDGEYDGVFEHTCFCAINVERREDYARAVAGAVRAGGRMLAVFFLDPGRDEEGPPYGCSVGELDALFGDTFRVLNEWRDFPTYPGREGRELLRLMERV